MKSGGSTMLEAARQLGSPGWCFGQGNISLNLPEAGAVFLHP
jgi:ribulose-5-phosphate 4-epimerase/fuculose-1-phosphate aldolase